ncbi:O-antigen ligase family protein [Ramlibacter sp. 2FC]|uniref:PglL family O-oligosaccharyltransferase n=1 Tax=Ramlibacter sp. 2FC TaxID=2502188 RepID=UPI001485A9BD|nr:O-antigen ligase family protein [Ramlibacter sp. 2FC]
MGLLMALAWLVPVHFPPWVSWHAEAPAFLVVLLGAGIAMPGPKGAFSHRLAVPLIAWPFLALAAWAVLQAAAGSIAFWGSALVFVLYAALCATALTLGYAGAKGAEEPACASADDGSLLERLAAVLLVGGMVSSAVAGAQAFDLWQDSAWIARMPSLRRPGGNMGQPNHLAILLVMAMASVMHLLAIRRLGGAVAALLWALLSAGLAMTESRAGLLGLGVLLLWWLAKRHGAAARTPAGWGPAAGGIAGLMFVVWPSVFAAVHMAGPGEVQGRLATGSLRLTVWPQLIEAVLMRPWWGWGMGNVAEAHNAVAHAYATSEPFTYSHNLVLDLALWLGIPATLVLVGATALWLWRRLRAASDAVSWYALAVALPVGVHAMLEFPHAYAYFLVPVMLALGVLEGRLGVRPLLRLGRRPAAVLLLAAAGFVFWSAVEYLRVEEDFRVARFEALRVGQTPAGHERPRVLLLTQLGALLDSMRIELRPGMPEGQLGLIRQMALRHPWTATQYRYALALALNGQGEEAARQMQVLRAQHGEKIHRQLREQMEQKLDDHHLPRDSLRLP